MSVGAVEQAARKEETRGGLVGRLLGLIEGWETRQRAIAITKAMKSAAAEIESEKLATPGPVWERWHLMPDPLGKGPIWLQLRFTIPKDGPNGVQTHTLSVATGEKSHLPRPGLRIQCVAAEGDVSVSTGIVFPDGSFEVEGQQGSGVKAFRKASQATKIFLDCLNHPQRTNYNRRG